VNSEAPTVDLAVLVPSLFGFPLEGMAAAGLADGVRQLDSLEAQVVARRAEYLAQAERAGVARQGGYGSTTGWLMAVSGDPAAVCRSRLAVATALEEMPETKAAFASGEVSESRVRLLAQAQALAPDQFAHDEAALVAQAAVVSATRLPQVLAQWRRTTDPAGAVADAERLHTLRALHISPAWSGLVHLDGDLDPEGGSMVLAALRSLSEGAALEANDCRTPAQCRADALIEICRRHLNAASPKGSQRPHVTVTIGWDALQQDHGVVDVEGGPVSAETVRRLACDATLIPMILDGAEPIAVGSSRRVIPPALRRALEVRDHHCSHPGCDTPARWCDAHHLQHWAQGGTTTLNNPRG